jgi:hypothetical protein
MTTETQHNGILLDAVDLLHASKLALFPMGTLTFSIDIAHDVGLGNLPVADVLHVVSRHLHGDYGDVDPEDRRMNHDAVAMGGRVFSVYGLKTGRVWIITEADRSATTVLYPSEY